MHIASVSKVSNTWYWQYSWRIGQWRGQILEKWVYIDPKDGQTF